jgi:anti-anti-sigma regulatory factor
MSAPKSLVFVYRQGRAVFCRVEGWGTLAHGLGLRQFAERCLADGATTMRVDLQQCDYLDSTFLGTLVCLHRNFARCGPEGFALVAPAPPCRELLAKMKLDAVLLVRPVEDFPPGGWTELPRDSEGEAFQTCVVQAHEELAKVPGPTSKSFHKLAAVLAKELEAKRQS